jgi:hypothetical protein
VEIASVEGKPRLDVTLDPAAGMAISDLPNRLVTAGFRITGMQQAAADLETAFLRLTKGLVA